MVPGITVRGSIDRQLEEIRHVLDVEAVQKSPMKEDGSTASPLGVSRELPLPQRNGQCQIRVSFDTDPCLQKRLEGGDLTLEDPSVCRVYRLQFRGGPWIQGDAVAKTPRALEHGTTTRSSTEDWDVGVAACFDVDGVGDVLAVSNHDKWDGGFPEPQEMAAGGLGFLQERIVPGH